MGDWLFVVDVKFRGLSGPSDGMLMFPGFCRLISTKRQARDYNQHSMDVKQVNEILVMKQCH